MSERTPVDTLGMFAATASMPEQIAAGVEAVADTGLATGIADPDAITSVLVLGMGGSGLVGDFLAVTAGPFMSLPVVVVKNYVPPSYVDRRTLVLAVSFSGETEETLSAAGIAAERGGQMVAVCTGGRLRALAESWGAPVLAVDPSIPMPRAGFAAMAAPVLALLEDLGFFPGASEWLARAAEQLRRRRSQLGEDPNPALRLAREIEGTIPVVYGPGGIGEVAARRWKAQFNENAKTPAFSAALPEMTHNEIAGWGAFDELTAPAFSAVQLRHDFEPPQVATTFDFLDDHLTDAVREVYEVRAGGDGPIAQIMDLMLFGDYVSLHLAALRGMDPGPIPAITELKAALRGSEEAGA
ncbi:MAG: bifunctional phosphoglucose/phosphomannose isomerase [bacterium]|nr:bifunctional phosphoglucose/phosphomannose isomerase [bacterium]